MTLRGMVAALGLAVLAGCAGPATQDAETRLGPIGAARQFASVVDTVQPVIERICRETRSDQACDFKIAVDTRRHQEANAFQSLDDAGNPILIFTIALIGDMRNPDELAFVMSHEASHHILDHLARQHASSEAQARRYAQAAARRGASEAVIRRASELGYAFGARSYSKLYELQADFMGTRIAQAAGYDPQRGALYFHRLPEPEAEFLGSHPPNADREAAVQAALGLGPCPPMLDMC